MSKPEQQSHPTLQAARSPETVTSNYNKFGGLSPLDAFAAQGRLFYTQLCSGHSKFSPRRTVKSEANAQRDSLDPFGLDAKLRQREQKLQANHSEHRQPRDSERELSKHLKALDYDQLQPQRQSTTSSCYTVDSSDLSMADMLRDSRLPNTALDVMQHRSKLLHSPIEIYDEEQETLCEPSVVTVGGAKRVKSKPSFLRAKTSPPTCRVVHPPASFQLLKSRTPSSDESVKSLRSSLDSCFDRQNSVSSASSTGGLEVDAPAGRSSRNFSRPIQLTSTKPTIEAETGKMSIYSRPITP